MPLFSISRLTVERQRNVGDRIAALLTADTSVKHKRPEAVLTRSAEFNAAHKALTGVSLLPKLKVDTAADRAFNGGHDELEAIETTFSDPLVALPDAAKARHDAARSLRRLAWTHGKGFTRKSMDTQLKGMRDVVTALRSDAAKPFIKTLNWGATVDFLEAMLAPYGVAVHSPDGADVEKLSDAWHLAFTNLAAALIGSLPEGDALRVGVLDAYEKQVNDQNDVQIARRRAAKKASAPKG